MGQLVHHEHDCDPVKMLQNVELALNVLQASSVALPDSIQKMTAAEIQDSEVHCFMFLETLRQAKNLGIIQLLEQGSWEAVKVGSTVNIIPLNLAPKPGAKPPWRLIVNAIEVNEHVVGKWPCRYEG